MFHPIDDCEHPLLYLASTGIVSQGTALLGSCQQNLSGICNSIWGFGGCIWDGSSGGLVSGWSILSSQLQRGPLVLQTLYTPVQGNARAKNWEWVGRGAGLREGIGNADDNI